jgi:hypothetical protein
MRAAAMAVMLSPEVFEASTVPGAASPSMRANKSCFQAISSGPDSTTRSADSMAASNPADPVADVNRATARAAWAGSSSSF